jgi:phospholipase/carboxylesterase
MAQRSFGDLNGFFTAPARGGQPSSLIFILHGWGADGADLADLAYPISLRFPGAAFFIPNAPDPCSMNPAGRQWFEIDDREAGPAYAAGFISSALAAACEEFNLPQSATALTGFSQGGMVSLHCGLHMQEKPGAIVSFSGALLQHDTLLPASETEYPPVQLVHGTADAVVPFSLMQAAADILVQKGITVETVDRPGLGHGIDPDGLTAAIDFLATALPA